MALRKNMRLSICKTAGGHWTTLSASRSRTSLSAVKKWRNVYVKKMMKLNFPFASEMTCPAWLSVLEGNQGPQGHYVFILDLSILGTGDTSKTIHLTTIHLTTKKPSAASSSKESSCKACGPKMVWQTQTHVQNSDSPDSPLICGTSVEMCACKYLISNWCCISVCFWSFVCPPNYELNECLK